MHHLINVNSLQTALFGIKTLDRNIKFDENFIKVSLVYTCLCWFIVFFVFISRLIQIKQTWVKIIKIKSLLITHILMIFFYLFYLTFHLFNTIGFFLTKPIVNCVLWYLIINISFWLGRVFQWNFLLWRSYWSFKSSIMETSKTLVLTFIIIHPIIVTIMVIGTWATAYPFPVPGKGFCTRIFPNNPWFSFLGLFYDVLCALLMCGLFIYKARSVRKMMLLNQIISKSGNKTRNKLFLIFEKHILLGILTCIGDIFVFIAVIIFQMMVGFIAMGDVASNCIFIYLIFAENHKIYKFCCWCFEKYSERNIDSKSKERTLEMQMQQHSNDSVKTESTDNETDTEIQIVGKRHEYEHDTTPVGSNGNTHHSQDVSTTNTEVVYKDINNGGNNPPTPLNENVKEINIHT